jgi:ribosomal protein S17E
MHTNSNKRIILEKYPDKITDELSLDQNAIPLLEKYPEKINWRFLSQNPSAIRLLEKYPEKINWYTLSTCNSNAESLLFNLDYKKMHSTFVPFAKEIAEYVFHPCRVQRFADNAGIDVADYLDLL